LNALFETPWEGEEWCGIRVPFRGNLLPSVGGFSESRVGIFVGIARGGNVKLLNVLRKNALI
jgi:hypothetical protein